MTAKEMGCTTAEEAKALREYAMELEAALDALARDLDMERAHRKAVEASEQALTAHMARLHSLLDELPDVMPVTAHLPMARIKGDYLERVDMAVRQGPANSLGIIKALWQAEILEATALKRPPGSMQRAWLKEQAEECRQSAPNH